MRNFILFLGLLVLPGCPELNAAFQDRGFGFLTYSSGGPSPVRIIRKVGLVEGRPGSAVRYEGILEATLVDDIAFVDGLALERVRVRGDGAQVFFYFQSRDDTAESIVRVFDIRSDQLILDVDARRFAEDAFSVCDYETILAERLPDQLRFHGIDPDIPFDVEYSLPPRSEARRRNIFPVGWTPDGRVAIAGGTIVRARISRDGEFLRNLDNVVGGLYLKYAFGSRVPDCSTEEPGVVSFRVRLPAGNVVSEIGERPRIEIGGETLYAFPTDRPDDARPLNIPTTRPFLFGFYPSARSR